MSVAIQNFHSSSLLIITGSGKDRSCLLDIGFSKIVVSLTILNMEYNLYDTSSSLIL